MSLVSPDSDSRLNGPNGMLALQIVARGRSSMINWLSTVTWCLTVLDVTCTILYHLVPSCTVWDASSKTQGQSGYGTAIQRQHPSSIVLKCFARVPPAPVRHLQISLAGPITYKMKWSIACKFSYDILSESSCITSGNWFVAPVCRPTEVRTVCGVPDQDVREAAEGSYETHPNLRFTFQCIMPFSCPLFTDGAVGHHGLPWAIMGYHGPSWATMGFARSSKS